MTNSTSKPLTPAAHSPIGASSMYRWKMCPGSINFCKNLPKVESEYAREGTRAHEIAAFLLENNFDGDFGWPKLPHPLLKDMPDDMIDAIQVYLDTIKVDLAEKSSKPQMFVECQFDLSSVYPGAFGTSDCVIYYPDKKFLRVYDYKHGQGVAVDVEDNSQLKYYALGALLKLNLPCDTVECVIVQPRCPHPDGAVRRWQFKAFELLDFAADIYDYAKKTESPDAPLVPGDHCGFCSGKGVCPALHEKALEVSKSEFSPVKEYDPEKLAKALKWVPVLETWIKGVREFAYQEAQHGRVPPGFKLVNKRVSRKWKDEMATEMFLLKNTRITEDLIYVKKMKTPAQVEKHIRINERRAIENAGLILAEPSGQTLVPESDKRVAVKTNPEMEFKPINQVTGG